MIRFVVRPKSILGTPKALAQVLGARCRFYPNPKKPNRVLDYKKDFLFTIPDEDNLVNPPWNIEEAKNFWAHSKFGQRALLQNDGIPVPKSAISLLGVQGWPQGRYVVRPKNHSQGKNYRITDDCRDFQEGREYISEVFPKTREYRIIFVYGSPVVLLRKKAADDEAGKPDHELPWNHTQGMYFQTVNDWASSPLIKNHPDCLKKLQANRVIQMSHIVGVDVLYRKDAWVVCEFNSCPSITIEDNLKTIAEFINARQAR